jgi:hypothetical protein
MPLIPEQNKNKYPLMSFDGGYNSKFAPHLVADNESPDLYNVVFDDRGAVGTREGYGHLNTTPVASYLCDGLYSYKKVSNSDEMVAFYNGCAYATSTTTFYSIPSGMSVFSQGGIKVEMTQYQDLIFVAHGGETPYKYNGVEFTRMGIQVPITTPVITSYVTVTANALGIGTYKYKIAYVNSYVVCGEAGTESSVFTASGTCAASLALPIPSAPSYGVDARYIYRTKTSGTTHFFLTVISNITAGYYQDHAADTALGSQMPDTSTKGLPPNVYKLVPFHTRMFGFDNADPTIIRYSEDEDPYNWPATNYIPFTEGEGELITNTDIIGNSLLILKENSIWSIYIPNSADDTTWQAKRAQANIGAVALRGNTDFENVKAFIGQKNFKLSGIHVLSEQGVEQFSQAGESVGGIVTDVISEKIEPDILALHASYITKACSITYNNLAIFAVCSAGASKNDIVFALDIRKRTIENQLGIWTRFKGLNPTCFAVHNGYLYFGDANATGTIYRLFNGGYNDETAAIDSYFFTKEFGGDIDIEDYHKDFRKFYFDYDTAGNYAMRIFSKIGGIGGDGLGQDVALNPGGTTWASFTWGGATWGGAKERDSSSIFIPMSGKRVQLKFTNKNTADQRFKMHRGSIFMNIRGAR